MAEYKKEIGTAVTAAIVIAVILGAVAIYSFPPPSIGNSTSGSTSRGTTGFGTTTMRSTTIPMASTYTNETVSLDSRLAVEPLGNLRTSTNATTVAEALASNLGELPIQPVSQRLPSCSDNSVFCTQSTYVFRTSTGSNISVDFISGSFYELDYIVQDYNTLYNGYWNSHSIGNPPTTAEDLAVGNLMLNSFGLDLSKVTLNDNVTGPGWAQWSQEYNGLQIANSGVVYFEVYPPTSEIIRLIIIEGAGWHLVPANFPLNVQASAALDSAKAYATNTLHVGYIGYASISLQIVQDHLYYAATLSNQSKTYILFVNPITGEVGFPDS